MRSVGSPVRLVLAAIMAAVIDALLYFGDVVTNKVGLAVIFVVLTAVFYALIRAGCCNGCDGCDCCICCCELDGGDCCCCDCDGDCCCDGDCDCDCS